MSVEGASSWAGDAEVAAAFVAGDATAFTALYERYVPKIHDFIRRTVRDRAAAEDLTQSTFLQAYERRESLHDPAAVRAWLYRIAHNAAINHVTRSRAVRDIDAVEAPPAAGPGPEEVAVQRESADLVWDAAASLEPRQYAVLDLTVRKGLSSAEIAEVLGVDAAQASVAVFRAREALGNAVRFLLVARRRRHCERLAELVPEGVRQLSAAQRASVDRHVRRCATCQRMALALTSPDRLFAALPLLAVPPALRHAPHLVPTAMATGPSGTAGTGGPGGPLVRKLVGGTAIGAVIVAAIVAGVLVTRHPVTRTVSAKPPVAATPSGRPAAAATTLRTFEPWARNVPSGEAAPRPGLIVTTASGTCDESSAADPGRAEAFRCQAGTIRQDTCFAPSPPLRLPGPAVLCSTDPTSPRVVLLSPTQPMPPGNAASPAAPPWFLVLAGGRTCARVGSGTDTAVLAYECSGGQLVTAPDRSRPAWTVRQGTSVNGAPVLSGEQITVVAAYR